MAHRESDFHAHKRHGEAVECDGCRTRVFGFSCYFLHKHMGNFCLACTERLPEDTEYYFDLTSESMHDKPDPIRTEPEGASEKGQWFAFHESREHYGPFGSWREASAYCIAIGDVIEWDVLPHLLCLHCGHPVGDADKECPECLSQKPEVYAPRDIASH